MGHASDGPLLGISRSLAFAGGEHFRHGPLSQPVCELPGPLLAAADRRLARHRHRSGAGSVGGDLEPRGRETGRRQFGGDGHSAAGALCRAFGLCRDASRRHDSPRRVGRPLRSIGRHSGGDVELHGIRQHIHDCGGSGPAAAHVSACDGRHGSDHRLELCGSHRRGSTHGASPRPMVHGRLGRTWRGLPSARPRGAALWLFRLPR